MNANANACRDCEDLTSASIRATRAHPYLVSSGTERDTGARQFLCVLCKSAFSFGTPKPIVAEEETA